MTAGCPSPHPTLAHFNVDKNYTSVIRQASGMSFVTVAELGRPMDGVSIARTASQPGLTVKTFGQ